MKKIAYIISTLHRAGPTNVLAGIVKNLDKTQFEPIIITLSPESDLKNSWWPEVEKWGVRIHCLNLSRWQSLFFGTRKFKQLINKINPSLVHCHCFRSAVIAAKTLKEYSKIATIHCDYAIDFKMAYGKMQGFLMSYFYTRALHKFNKRIACSEILADLLNKKYSNMHFDFVNNGVDIEKFCPAKDKVALRKELKLPVDKKIIIWAGAFIPRKDPITMVEAIEQIPRDKYFFVFCGARGPLLEECKELLKQRKDVLFTGYITNIEKYYQTSDIYVSTSLSEGLPLAVLEAEFCENIPLLSNIAQHKYILPLEVLPNCTYTGKEELLRKLNTLLEEDTKYLLSFIQVNLNSFSAKNMAIHYQDIYDDIL
jgi:glycosyltransferase involved in cell wall biosynthesis